MTNRRDTLPTDPPPQGPSAALPSHPLRTQSLSNRKPTRFDLAPDAAGRAAIAAALGLLELPALRLKGELRPVGRQDFDLVAELVASAVQPCSLTLAPVPSEIREEISRRYLAEMATPEGDEVEMADPDTDPLPEVIDLAAIAAEALALALPLYPRAAGASLGEAVFAPPGVAPIKAEDLKPFAGLSALAEKLKKPDSDPSEQG